VTRALGVHGAPHRRHYVHRANVTRYMCSTGEGEGRRPSAGVTPGNVTRSELRPRAGEPKNARARELGSVARARARAPDAFN